MVVLVIFEAVFAYVRQYLIVHLTTRVDVKLGTYMFDKVLNLPIDFFERTQTGKITHDMQQMWKIRTFLMGQLFGTVLDSTTLLVFIPVMFFFSPIMTLIVLAACALMVGWIVVMLPAYRRKTKAVEAAEAERGAFLVQTIHGIRTVKSLAARCAPTSPLGCADGARCKIAVCRRHDGQSDSGRRAAVGAVRRQRVLRGWCLFGAYDQRPRLYRGTLCLPDAVAARVWAVAADGQARQPV